LTCGAQRSVAVSPCATPWLAAVGGAVRTRACGIKSALDRAVPTAPPFRPHRLRARAVLSDASRPPCRHSDRVGPKSPSPPNQYAAPLGCPTLTTRLASCVRPPPRSEASPGAKPPPCPPPDSRVRRLLPAPPPELSILAIPAVLPASAVAAEAAVRAITVGMRAPHAVGTRPGVRAQRGSPH
jgi:hypothetical protein